MPRLISASDIKWAYSRKLISNPMNEFMDCLCVFIGEILRSDEIGLLIWQSQPILMVKISKVDFESENHYVETFNFDDSKIKIFIDKYVSNLNLSTSPAIGISGMEIFCYRPKLDKPYHPKIHPSYTQAREKASRILSIVFLTIVEPTLEISCVSLAQVDAKILSKLPKGASVQESDQGNIYEIIDELQSAVGRWIAEFYTDEIGTKKYRIKNKYPLAPNPLSGTTLFFIGADDDGNLISYQTNT